VVVKKRIATKEVSMEFVFELLFDATKLALGGLIAWYFWYCAEQLEVKKDL
jgi:hypothetical protein